MVKWHKQSLTDRQYLSIGGGKKIAMPRYYKNKIYNSEEIGFLKGYNEQKRHQLDAEKLRTGKIQTFHQRSEYVKSALRKMDMPDTKHII